MERFLITTVALAIPAYFYTWVVRSIDRFEKEPVRYLIYAFLWGALPAVIACIIVELILQKPVTLIFGEQTLPGEFASTAVNAPVTEEILKGMAVAIIYLTRRREFDGWVDGIVYGAIAGFGFAYVENIAYLLPTENWKDWTIVFILRVFAFGGLHGFWTALTGIGFGVARYLHNPLIKILAIAGGLIAAMLGHFIHNGSLTLAAASGNLAFVRVAFVNYGALTLFMIVLWFVAGYNDRKMLKTYLQDEVPHVLSIECYTGLCHPRSGVLAALGMNRTQRRALFQVAAELAQKKLQLSKMGEEDGNSVEIANLRQELRRLVDG